MNWFSLIDASLFMDTQLGSGDSILTQTETQQQYKLFLKSHTAPTETSYCFNLPLIVYLFHLSTEK